MRDPHMHGAAGGCPDDVRDLLPALLHGRLAGEARARAEAHVADCADCAAEFALLGDVRGAISATAPAVDVAAIAAAVRAATAAPPAGPASPPPAVPAAPRAAPASVRRPSRWRVSRAWQAAAASLVLALGVGSTFVSRTRNTDSRSTSAATTYVAASERADGRPAASAAPSPTRAEPGPASADSARPRADEPTLLASAEPALGAGLDDLSDAELDAVLAAVTGDEGALPSEEPEAALPAVWVPGGR